MALRKIICIEDELLRKKSRPVEKFDEKLHKLLDDMAETMYNANGVGLAAPQVNARRITLVQVTVASALGFASMPIAGEGIPAFSLPAVGAACGLGVASALIQGVINWAQRKVSPTRATLIYACEPVWGGFFGRLAGERLPWMALFGGALVVGGVLVSSLPAGKKENGTGEEAR